MSPQLINESQDRLTVLRNLLSQGNISTQEEIVEHLRARQFNVTQSTISRDLSRLNAIKVRDTAGSIVYRLPEDSSIGPALPGTDLKGLIVNISHNGSMIVIQTTPGSASLIARQLDQTRPGGLLGTIAGDDTIFVAPKSSNEITTTIQAILGELV